MVNRHVSLEAASFLCFQAVYLAFCTVRPTGRVFVAIAPKGQRSDRLLAKLHCSD